MFSLKSGAVWPSLLCTLRYAGLQDAVFYKGMEMIFKKARILFCAIFFLVALPLVGCRDANPLIGDWTLNTSTLDAATVARLKGAAPDSTDNFMTLSFSGKYVLLGTYFEPPPRKKYITPTDMEYYEDPEGGDKPDQGRKIPVTYQVIPAAPGKKPVVHVTLEGRPTRQVTVYSYGQTEFIIWPVNGVEYRYERPMY